MLAGRRSGVYWLIVATCVVSSAFAQTPPVEPPPADTPPVSTPDLSTEKDTDVPAGPVDETPAKAREICVDDNRSRAVIDRLHSQLYKLSCSSATWFDGLFGNARYDEVYRSTYGSLTTGALWSQRDDLEGVLRFRVRMDFPQMNKRFHAFIGRVDREDYVTESAPNVYGLPNQFNRDTRETTLVGIGYKEPLTKRGSFDVSTGVHLAFPVDPYVKGSYRFARPIGDSNLIRLRETIFWQNSEQFGMTSTADWDRAIGDRHLLRYTASGTFSQETIGVRWYTVLTLFHFINSDRAFAYEAAANGDSDDRVPLKDYGGSIIFRQRLSRDWLLLELRAGLDWPRDFLFEHRHSNINAGFAFELRFGRDPDYNSDTK